MSELEFKPQGQQCLVCGSERLRSFKAQAADAESPSLINVMECESCVFAWQYPLGRDEQQSLQFFETAYADEGQTISDYFSPDLKREIAELEHEFLAGLPVGHETLLDIGAGTGTFAEVAAEHAWNVTAVDPALDIERIRSNPMIKAVKGTTEQIARGELFDVVTMWDVIEHTTNPLDQIADARQYLKEGGWLVIETGNYKSASRVMGGTSHWMYQLDHRWYFSPESLEQLLREAGFSEFIFSERVLRPGWHGRVDYAGPTPASLLKSAVKDPLHLRMHLSRYSWLKRAAAWQMPGIGIFALAARTSRAAS